MNDQQLVTISITAEEFNRFQGNENNLNNLKSQLGELISNNTSLKKDIEKQRAQIEVLENSIKVLESNTSYFKVPYQHFVVSYCGYHSTSFSYSKIKEESFYVDYYSNIDVEKLTKDIRANASEALNKIPKWIRKIFGAA